MTIGILAAMTVECEQVEALLTEKTTEQRGPHTFIVGRLAHHHVVLLQCGIGKVNASAGVTNLIIHYQPQAILSTGCAGGVAPHLHVGDVVASTQTSYHDVYCGEGVELGQIQGLPPTFQADATLLTLATTLQTDTPVHPGPICSGDRFVTHPSELDAIRQNNPHALAVDMESAAIAHVCHLYHIPFLSFRVISDTPGVEAHMQQYHNFWQTMAERSFAVTRQFLQSL